MNPIRRVFLAVGLVAGGLVLAGSTAQAGVNVIVGFGGGGYCGRGPVYYNGCGPGYAYRPVYRRPYCNQGYGYGYNNYYQQRSYCGPRSVTYVPGWAYGNGNRCR